MAKSASRVCTPRLALPARLERTAVTRSSSLPSKAMDSRCVIASSSAMRYPRTMVLGWTPCKTRCHAFRSSSAAMTTADVVPSRAARSWADEASMSMRATGCSTRAVSRTVTPSLVTKVRPSSSRSNLSRPFGPRVLRTAPDRAIAAAMFLRSATRPVVRSVSSSTGASAMAWPPGGTSSTVRQVQSSSTTSKSASTTSSSTEMLPSSSPPSVAASAAAAS